jgi:hypothetical protein
MEWAKRNAKVQEGNMKGHYKSESQGCKGHHTLVSTWLAGITILLLIAPALATSDRTFTILTVADNSKERGIHRGTEYNPTVSYPGSYEASQLYRKNMSTGAWKARNHPAQLSDVNCFEAKAQLDKHGLWKGNLSQDGSCEGSAEASDWATGNFLNFHFQGSEDATDTEGETE